MLIALSRMHSTGFERGLARVDGFGDEYGGGRSWGRDFGRVEEKVGERSHVL